MEYLPPPVGTHFSKEAGLNLSPNIPGLEKELFIGRTMSLGIEVFLSNAAENCVDISLKFVILKFWGVD